MAFIACLPTVFQLAVQLLGIYSLGYNLHCHVCVTLLYTFHAISGSPVYISVDNDQGLIGKPRQGISTIHTIHSGVERDNGTDIVTTHLSFSSHATLVHLGG